MTAPRFGSDSERWAAIHRSVVAKLRPLRGDLVALDLVQRGYILIREALAEFWDDPIDAGYMWDPVESIVRRAVAEAAASD